MVNDQDADAISVSKLFQLADYLIVTGVAVTVAHRLPDFLQGMALGFPEKSADVRLAQYETGSRTPKADLTAALAQVLDVSPHALSVPDIDSYVGLMHTLFTLEDNYGLKISEMDGEVCLKVDVRKSKDAARLHEMLCSWQQAAAMLEAGEISKEDYDKWRYHYPEFDKAQTYVKVPPQDLF